MEFRDELVRDLSQLIRQCQFMEAGYSLYLLLTSMIYSCSLACPASKKVEERQGCAL